LPDNCECKFARLLQAIFLKKMHWAPVKHVGRGDVIGSDAPPNRPSWVYSGAWQIGHIYERRGFPGNVRWVWSLYGVVLTRPTLEAAKAEFGASWKRWLEWAKLEEVP
jgi:hypothetical protein